MELTNIQIVAYSGIYHRGVQLRGGSPKLKLFVMLSCLLKVQQWHNSKETEIQSFKCLQWMGEVNHLIYGNC